MQSVANRRTFVRQLAVAVPVLATTSVPRVTHAAGTTGHEPALPSELAPTVKALAALHNELLHRRPTADDARRIGAHIRTIATYRLHHGSDAALAASVRAAVARDGRQAFTVPEPDAQMMRDELAAMGFEQPLASLGPSTAGARDAAIERLLRGGLTPSYLEATVVIELLVTSANGSCETLQEMKRSIEAMAAVMCMLAQVLPVLAPECFAATAVLAMLTMSDYLFCS